MRRTVRTVTTILFVAVVAGCAFAVLYLGTATGLTFGGEGSQLAQAVNSNAVYAQVGWIRNTAPWPVTVQSIITNATGSSGEPTVFLEREQSGAHVSSGSQPNWALNASRAPYQLDGGALRFLGFALRPKSTSVAYLTSITVHFTGPLGLQFTSTFTGTTVAAAASNLPSGVLAQDPTVDGTSLDAYIAALRDVLLQPSPSDVAAVMGNGATTADGAALLKLEAGFVTTDSVTATPEPGNRRRQKLVFYLNDPVKGALPPISVEWSGFRWTVVRT
jgi:hypothetical protein